MSEKIYYLLIILTALMSAVSQILLNFSNRIHYPSKLREYLNPYVITSYAILGLTVFINNYALRFLPLKISHALAATTYIFVLILSRIFLGEKVTLRKVVGNIMIILGIIVFIM